MIFISIFLTCKIAKIPQIKASKIVKIAVLPKFDWFHVKSDILNWNTLYYKRTSYIAWSKKKLCLFLSSKTVEAWLAELIFWQLFDLTRKLVCAMWIICSLSSAAHNNGCFNTQCGYFMTFLSLRFYVESILRILEVKNLPF